MRVTAPLALCLACAAVSAQPRRRRRDAGVRDVPSVTLRPATRGRLDPAAVRATVASVSDAVRRCYEQVVRRDATARGELEVRVRVEPDGSVSDTAGRSEESALRGVSRCIEAVFRATRFPRPTGGAATVVVPYRFAPGE